MNTPNRLRRSLVGSAAAVAAAVTGVTLMCAAAAPRVVPADPPGRGSRHARPRALAVDARGDVLYVALSTRDRLAVIDVAGGRARPVVALPMCAFPDALAALPTGGVVVACRFDPGLRVVTRAPGPDPAGSFQVRVIDAGPEHGDAGIALEPRGRFVYVASPALGGVKIVPLLPGAASGRRFVATGLAPRAVHILPRTGAFGPGGRGPLLLVSNFLGHTVTVHEVEADGGLSAALQTIRTEAPVLDMAVVPAAAVRPAAAAAGWSAAAPVVARDAIFGATPTRGDDPDDDLAGALVLATHEDRALSRAQISVEGLDSVLLVLRRAPPGGSPPFIDAGPGRRQAINLTERARQPLVELDALVIDARDGGLAVVGAGTDNLLLAVPRVAALLGGAAVAVGAQPAAVAFLPDGRVVTADRLSDTLTFVPASRAAPAATPQTVSVGIPARPSAAERGEVLFFSRALVPHNVADGPLSVYTCAACHADGQTDGRMHPSKRNRFFSMTKTCRGLAGTEPFLSLGKPATFSAFADNIVATHAQGALTAPATFDRYPVTLRLREGDVWRAVTLSPEQVRTALAAYMARIPTEPSPFVVPGRHALIPAERRGLVTFRAQCAGCHQLVRSTANMHTIPADQLEASLLSGTVALTSPRLYDVGTPVLGEGGNNPPSLKNVWAAAPYFSDGSAATLEDVLDRTDPTSPAVHGAENAARAPAFSAAARADLLAFLRAL